MSSVIIFGLILLAAFALLHYVNSISHPEDIITRNRTYYETSKFSFVVMSDCIDCSIYMKRITLQSMPIQHVMIHGLACLSINAPHSVAPDSGLSMFIYYRQDFDGLAESKLLGYMGEGCLQNKGSKCTLRDYPSFIGSHIQLHKGRMMNSNLAGAWRTEAFNSYEQYEIWTRINLTYPTDDRRVSHRSYRRFPISNLLNSTLADESSNKIFQQYWLKKMKLSTTNGNLKDLTISHLFNSAEPIFLSDTTKEGQKTTNNYIPLPLDFDRKEGAHLLLLLSKSNFVQEKTSSIFSAFVVKIVYALMVKWNLKKSTTNREQCMYDYILKAQKIAYGVFANSLEWKNDPIKTSMLSNDTLRDILEKWETGHLDLMNISAGIRRTKPDRVATIINWRKNTRETITMLNIGLPSMFDSEYIHGQQRSEYSVFNNNGQESSHFTSAAGLIVAYKNKLDNLIPLMVASASGSVRTVEAVSTVLLRMLLLNESPGEAIAAPSAYWDVRDGKYYCENDTQRARELFRTVPSANECHSIPTNDFAANDRIAMAASKSRGPNQYIKASVDKRAVDFNYAAGY